MSEPTPSDLTNFNWQRQPAAERLLVDWLDGFLSQCPVAADLARRMRDDAGTRFFDWIDHILIPHTDTLDQRLLGTGYVRAGAAANRQNSY